MAALVADAYPFDAAPDRTVMAMTCCADAALSAPAAFHPGAFYEFRFDTTGNGRDDTGFQVCFTNPIERADLGVRQEFTVHYVIGADLDVDPAQYVAGKPGFSAELNTPARAGAVEGFAGLVGDMWAADPLAVRRCSTISTSTGPSRKPHTPIGATLWPAATRWRSY